MWWSFRCRSAAKKVAKGQDISVQVMHSSGMYSLTVPLSAVFGENQGLFVYVLRTRQGLFGEEQYVYQTPVEKIAANNLRMAVNSESLSPYDQVVTYTSAPLASGRTVKVVR